MLAFAALGLLVVGIEHIIVRLPAFPRHPALSWAVLFDVLVGLPLLFYVLLLRRYRAAGVHETRPLPRLRLAAGQVLGIAGVLLVAELDMLRSALLGWWEPVPAPLPGAAVFASHRESGFGALLGVACFGLLIESAALHLLVRMGSPMAAGWLLVAYACVLLLFIAHGHAIRLQPTVLTVDELLVRVGFFWHVAVPRGGWPSAELLLGDFAIDAETLNLARSPLTAPNVMLTFAAPVFVTGPYGIRRPARRLALYLDQPMASLDALSAIRS